jgi:SAM-dependent methyltransferase
MKPDSAPSQADAPARASAEFDRFSGAYEQVHNRYLPPGARSHDFLMQKAGMVKHWVSTCFPAGESLSVLDFGCGTGRLLAAIADSAWCQALAGVDESGASLAEARAGLKPFSKPVAFGTTLAALGAQRQHDLVLMFNVLHHIPVANRVGVVRDVFATVREGGVLAVWEHNPFNPLTRVLVAISPLDEHAHLISRRQTMALMRQAGFESMESRYVNLFPPRLAVFSVVRRLDDALSGVPAGAQYWSLFRRSVREDAETL